jgi:hypothetical protein
MSVQFTSPDAMIAAAAHVEREYGYGYRIGCESGMYSGAGIFLVSCSDGGEFRLCADKWGNVDRIPDDWRELTGEQQVTTLRLLRERREARIAEMAR